MIAGLRGWLAAAAAALLSSIQGGCSCNDESTPHDTAVDTPDDQVWDYMPVPQPPGLADSLGEYDPDYGFPAPQWFRDLEVITTGTNHELDGLLEFSHSAGGFQAARDGYYAAGSYADAGLAQRREWNAMGSRVSTYQDSPRFGIIEHNLGIEWCVENYGEDWTILEDRWYAGQQGWPGKYVNKDGHEEAWNLYDENGDWIWKFDFYPGRHYTCLNLAATRSVWVTAYRTLMELGHDAVFVDNYGQWPTQCYGPDHGKHEHLWPDRNNNQTVVSLYGDLYNTVKSYHPERVLWANATSLHAPWPFVDGQMRESLFQDYSDSPTPDIFDYALSFIREHEDAVRHGKVVVIMPLVNPPSAEGLGVPGDDLDRVFFEYAFCRLAKFVVTFRVPEYAGLLNFLRLKNVLGEIVEAAPGVFYRVYDRGIVVLNATAGAQTVTLPLQSAELQESGNIVDVRTETSIVVPPGASSVEVTVPAYSGRVFATPQAFDLAKISQLPDKPASWEAPLSPGVKVAPPEVIFEGPEAFWAWHAAND